MWVVGMMEEVEEERGTAILSSLSFIPTTIFFASLFLSCPIFIISIIALFKSSSVLTAFSFFVSSFSLSIPPFLSSPFSSLPSSLSSPSSRISLHSRRNLPRHFLSSFLSFFQLNLCSLSSCSSLVCPSFQEPHFSSFFPSPSQFIFCCSFLFPISYAVTIFCSPLPLHPPHSLLYLFPSLIIFFSPLFLSLLF